MAQNRELGELGQYLSVNTTSNVVSINAVSISVGNSSVNTTANSASFLPGLMYHNYQNINIDYTIANNYSASMVGPVTIAAGKTLTVNSGARFVVI